MCTVYFLLDVRIEFVLGFMQSTQLVFGWNRSFLLEMAAAVLLIWLTG